MGKKETDLNNGVLIKISEIKTQLFDEKLD